MDKLDQLINVIGNFKYKKNTKEIEFLGFLSKDKDTYTLNARVDKSYLKEIDFEAPMTICGIISGTKITFFKAYMKNSRYRYEDDYFSMVLNPSKILIGICCFEEPILKSITLITSSINRMFNSSPIQLTYEPSGSEYQLLKTSPPIELNAQDKYGQLKVSQGFSTSFNREEYRCNIASYINYSFNAPIPMTEAVARIASANNLFSFFGNCYLPLNYFELCDTSDNADLVLFLNNTETKEYNDEAFLITSNVFLEKFNDIWNKWVGFYEESYIPTLFYEMVCNRSTGINRFLNLMQAIEIYSKKYRKNEAKLIAQKRNLADSKKGLYLKHRVEDVFECFKSSFNINDDERMSISEKLANFRNLYTHYNETFTEPQYEVLFAACHLLEFILLAIVYRHLGIDDSAIMHIKKFSHFQGIDYWTKMLL